jgi:uncharacterized protein with PQ loop repeat
MACLGQTRAELQAAFQRPHKTSLLLQQHFDVATTLPTMAASFLQIVSWLFGWVYFFCWSFSFYPQAILNFRRKSTSGSTVDFPAINVTGFISYFTSNAAFLFSSQIRREYALRNHGLTPTVQINDLAFAGHAIVLTAITLTQYLFPAVWGFEKRGKGEHGVRMSSWVKGVIVGGFLGVGLTAFIVSVRHDEDTKTGWAWIDVVRIPANGFTRSYTDKLAVDLCRLIRQNSHHTRKIHAPSHHELSQPIYTRVVDYADTSRLCRRDTFGQSAADRQLLAG